jgi:PKHD-type hydroxylase
MFLEISNVLVAVEVEAIREAVAGAAFVSGASTAGGHARTVKDNEQSNDGAILKKTEAACRANPVFMAAARPQSFVKLMVSRYRPGMQYGLHVDEPVMNGARTDLSFTLFLSDPASYDGGALIIEGNDGTRDFKLAAGSLVLYPPTTLHRVEPVTRGERLAVVGWVRSLIRSHENRELLFDLDNALAALRQGPAERAVLDRLYKVRANLIRQWAED